MAHVEMAMIDEKRNRTKLKECIAGQREAIVVVKMRRIGIGFHKLGRVESFRSKELCQSRGGIVIVET